MGMIEIGPQDELKKLYHKPANRKIKLCSIIAISITLALLIAILIWMNQLSNLYLSILKGFVGLFAIIFVVLYGVLVYRVNREFIDKRGR